MSDDSSRPAEPLLVATTAPAEALEPAHVLPSADPWPHDSLGARLRQLIDEEGLRGHTYTSLSTSAGALTVPTKFIDSLAKRGDLMPRTPAVTNAQSWARWAVSGVYGSVAHGIYGHVLEALLAVDRAHHPEQPDFIPLVRHVHSAVLGGAGLMRQPEPVALDEATLDELTRRLEAHPSELDFDDLTVTFSLLGSLRREGKALLDACLSRYTFTSSATFDPVMLASALAVTFPLWDDRLERLILPLDDGHMDELVTRCTHIGASPDELERTRALAWRRLTHLCLHRGAHADPLHWFEELTVALEANRNAGALTALVVGLELYHVGHTAHATRVWRAHA